MDCFLGIDLGTSAVKVIVVDRTGACLAIRERGYAIRQPSPGFAEQSPEDWWNATVECIREVLGSEKLNVDSIASIGLSGQMHGLVMLDTTGAPLRDAIIWPDTRSAGICAQWSRSESSGMFHSTTGLPLATGFLAPSLEWVRREEPDVYRRTATVLLPKDYIRFKLTGRIATDPSDASGTYLFDISKRTWAASLIDTLGVNKDFLPELVETLSLAGTLTHAAADRTGLRTGIPVAAGGSDQAMAALGLGLDRPGQVAVAISTGGTVITPVDSPLVDHRLHTLCHAFKDKWLLMGAVLSAGSAISWFADNVIAAASVHGTRNGRPTIEQLVALADEVPAGSNGLFFLPYLSGERTPHMNPNAQGSFVGLTLYHTSAHMVHAIMEGVAYSLYDSVEIFRERGLNVHGTLCYAGGSRSRTWRQIISDIFECPIHWRRFSDYSALGAAFCGAAAVGVPLATDASIVAKGSDPAAASSIAKNDECTPRDHDAERYRERRRTFQRLYTQLEPLFDEISGYRE